MKLIKHILIISAVVFSILSCEKNEEGIVASRFEIRLGAAIGEDGTSSTRAWEADDQVALIRVAGDKVEHVVASPLMEGRNDGLFMFNWEGYQAGAEIIAYYPADAAVTYQDGVLDAAAPKTQDGSLKHLYIGKGVSNGSSFLEEDLVLESYWHTFAVTVKKGDYSITKAEFVSEQQNVTVDFASPMDCRKKAGKFFISLLPATYDKGYTLTFTTSDDETFVVKEDDETLLAAGEMTQINEVGFPSELVVCGDNMIYIIDADKAYREGFSEGITWQWDANSVASTVGPSDMTRLDDCKVVDNGTKILATSSYSWAVLLDIATKELLWWSYSSKNAHSAELLPGGRIAVACSVSDYGNGDRVQIFDISKPNQVLSYVDLSSAHGVVWNESTQRLYAVGGSVLNIYTLTNWDSTTPTLTLERSIDTSKYVTGLHDLTLVNSSTLLLAGRKAALYELTNGTFTTLPHFNESKGLKSVNYNPVSGDCWYTDATSEANHVDYDWATRSIFYTSNIIGSQVDRQITIPQNFLGSKEFHMYKVRVKNW